MWSTDLTRETALLIHIEGFWILAFILQSCLFDNAYYIGQFLHMY